MSDKERNTEDKDYNLVMTFWLEQAAETLANSVHDFNRYVASGYSYEQIRAHYLKITEQITNLKARADEIKIHCESTLYGVMVDDMK